MFLLLVDENFDLRIVRGLRRRFPAVDVLTVREVGLTSRPDPEILLWAADHGRIVLTHDVTTMTGYALERVEAGLPMPGVFVARQEAAIGVVIDDLVLLLSASVEDEWANQIRHMPL